MAKFSIAQVRKDAMVRFGDFEIEDVTTEAGDPVVLVHTLRLNDEQREALKNAKDMSDVDNEDELVEVFQEWARIVAQTPEQGEALVEAVGKAIDVWAELQVQWTSRTQPGEASTSES